MLNFFIFLNILGDATKNLAFKVQLKLQNNHFYNYILKNFKKIVISNTKLVNSNTNLCLIRYIKIIVDFIDFFIF